MLEPGGRCVEHHGLLSCGAVANDDEHEADQRDDGVQPLPSAFTKACLKSVTRRARGDGNAVDAQKEREAKHEVEHGKS